MLTFKENPISIEEETHLRNLVGFAIAAAAYGNTV